MQRSNFDYEEADGMKPKGARLVLTEEMIQAGIESLKGFRSKRELVITVYTAVRRAASKKVKQ